MFLFKPCSFVLRLRTLSMGVANFVKHSCLNVLKSMGIFLSAGCLPLLKLFPFPNSLTGGNGSFDHMAGMVHGWNR
jgi:hypothetical protein